MFRIILNWGGKSFYPSRYYKYGYLIVWQVLEAKSMCGILADVRDRRIHYSIFLQLFKKLENNFSMDNHGSIINTIDLALC
jgi:hypothetical protein